MENVPSADFFKARSWCHCSTWCCRWKAVALAETGAGTRNVFFQCGFDDFDDFDCGMVSLSLRVVTVYVIWDVSFLVPTGDVGDVARFHFSNARGSGSSDVLWAVAKSEGKMLKPLRSVSTNPWRSAAEEAQIETAVKVWRSFEVLLMSLDVWFEHNLVSCLSKILFAKLPDARIRIFNSFAGRHKGIVPQVVTAEALDAAAMVSSPSSLLVH